MTRWNRRGAVALLVSVCALVQGCQSEPGPGAQAARVVEELRSRGMRMRGSTPLERPVLPPSEGAEVQRVAGGFTAVSPRPSRTSLARPARVVLPELARQSFRLEDERSGLALDVALEGASPSRAEVVDGYVVYPGSREDGADVVHRFTAEGTEDYVSFGRAPASPEVHYALELGTGVMGLRLVGNVLEALDAAGAPRLRMSPPYVVGADGQVSEATVSVEGCAVDTRLEAPWGRSVTAPGSRHCRIRVAWDGQAVRYPAVLDPAWMTTGSMAVARTLARSLLLPSGKVLVVGGQNANLYTPASELFDPATGTWAMTGSLANGRRFHTLTLLPSGKVLATGGNTSAQSFAATVELYDPATGTWSSLAPMNKGRYSHAASVLGDGRVLISGGTGVETGATTNAEVYDPVSNTWTTIAPMLSARSEHSTYVLANGQVLTVSGNLSSEIYDPATGTWSATGRLNATHVYGSSTRLADGRILLAGGETPVAELYDPNTGTWSNTGALAVARQYTTTSLLQDGRVLIAGGSTNSGQAAADTAELYDPATGLWSPAATLKFPRANHVASVLPDGRVLIAGGTLATSPTTYTASAELFTFDTQDDTAPTASLTAPAAGATLQGTVTLTSSVADNVGVVRVEFYTGSSLLGAVTAPPYSLAWNTRGWSNGAQTLTVKAFDAAGNSVTSSPVSVTLDNDLNPPVTTVTSPVAGSNVQGTVTLTASASDDRGVTRVELYVDSGLQASLTSPPYSVSWPSDYWTSGSHVVTSKAYDAAGNMGSSSVTVTVRAPGSSLATYDTSLGAPRCSTTMPSCDSGTLLSGRASLGPEPNQPNTVDTCTDGSTGAYHSDESLDRLKVSTLDGTNLAVGKTVRIDATVWAFASYTSDRLDLYFAPDASSPVWRLIGTYQPTAGGAQTLSTNYTLPSGGPRAVIRGIFRFGTGSAAVCPGGVYTDVDDVVFSTQ